MSSNKIESWDVNSNNNKKNFSAIKIFSYLCLYSILIALIFCIFDFYIFYKSEKTFFSQSLSSYQIVISNLTENLKNKHYKKLNEDLVSLNLRHDKINQKIDIYKDKPSFRLSWVSSKLEDVTAVIDEWTYLFRLSVKLSKSIDKLFSHGVFEFDEIENDLNTLNTYASSLSGRLDGFDYFFLPVHVRDKIGAMKQKLDFLIAVSDEVSRIMPIFKDVLWSNGPRNTVVLLQNSNELRPTWWFIWSFILIKSAQSKINDFSVNDIYDFDGQINTNITVPFEAEGLVWDKTWSLRDANTSPDIALSARYFNYFFEKSWWDTLDNFIFVDLFLFRNVLKLVWNIDLSSSNIKLNEDNFDLVLQYFIEWNKHYSFSLKQKILGELMQWLISRIDKMSFQEKMDFAFGLVSLKQKFIENKSMQAVSLLEDSQKLFEDYWFCSDFWNSENFVAPVLISISWNKSDRFIKNSYSLTNVSDHEFVLSLDRQFEIWDFDRDVIDILFWKKWIDIPAEKLKEIMWFASNNSILQIYLPRKYDLIFVFEGGNKIEHKVWMSWNNKVYELFLPVISEWQRSLLEMHFKSDEMVKDIEIWRQAWLN